MTCWGTSLFFVNRLYMKRNVCRPQNTQGDVLSHGGANVSVPKYVHACRQKYSWWGARDGGGGGMGAVGWSDGVGQGGVVWGGARWGDVGWAASLARWLAGCLASCLPACLVRWGYLPACLPGSLARWLAAVCIFILVLGPPGYPASQRKLRRPPVCPPSSCMIWHVGPPGRRASPP